MVKEEVDWCLGWGGVQVMVGRLWMIYDPHDHSNYSLSPSAHKPGSSVSGPGHYYYFLTTSRHLDQATNGSRWWWRSTSAKLAHFDHLAQLIGLLIVLFVKGCKTPVSESWVIELGIFENHKCLTYPNSLSWAKEGLTRKRDFVGISSKWRTPTPLPPLWEF